MATSEAHTEAQVELFEAPHLASGIVVTALVSLALVLAPTGVAVVVLPALAWACARAGGIDAGLGSMSTGGFMFGWAITEPHFVWEIQSGTDQALLLVMFAASAAAVALGTRERRRAAARRTADARDAA